MAIKASINRDFPSIVHVAGEISSYKPHTNGQVYLTLKDDKSQLPAVIWQSALRRFKFEPKLGMAVIAGGGLEVYAPHGKYQFSISTLEPQGIGARELALRQLREKLFTKGYFSRKRKPLPQFPRRIALVTSPSGAAVRDMLEVLARRWPACGVLVCPVPVQGDGAGQKIAAMIDRVNELRQLAINVMIVGRGGGSAEDLWAFNEECVADAIFRSRIPVISAVGHEIDVSISDRVADVHALTPTDAATRVVPDRADLLTQCRERQLALFEALRRRLKQGRQRWDALAGHSVFRRPMAAIHDRERHLDELTTRLQRSIRRRLERADQETTALAEKLRTLSPLNILGRGYSLTQLEGSAELIRDAERVQAGDLITTRVARGLIVSRVERTDTEPSDLTKPTTNVRDDESEAGTA
jgi:exodeoxyribonuclease VII large subunit